MLEKYKKIIIIVIVLGIGFLVYSLTRPDPELVSGLSVSDSAEETEILSQEIVRAISQIKSLKLDKAIFDDPVLKSLDDKSELIKEQPRGRQNPFAPISQSTEGGAVRETNQTNN